MGIRRLTVQFLLIVFALLAAVTAVSTVTLLVQLRSIVDDVGRRYAVERAEAAASRITGPLQREAALAGKLAGSPVVVRWMRDEQNDEYRRLAFEELASYQRAFVDANYFVAVDASKTYYNQPADGPLVVTHLSRENAGDAWYYATLAAGAELSFNLDYNPTLDRSMVWINCLVQGPDGPIGVAGTGLEITDLISRIVTAGGEETRAMLVDLSGAIIADQDVTVMERNARAGAGSRKITVYDRADSGDDRRALQRLRDDAVAGLSAVDVVDLDGHSSLVAMTAVREIDALLVASVNTDSFISLSDFGGLFLLLVVSVLVAVAILAIIMERLVLRPLEIVTESAREIARGNYELTVPEIGKHEMGRLAGAFNRMAAEISRHTSNLEGLVAERTQALTEANNKVTESIRYARLIQDGVMPTEAILADRLGDFALFHRQRDIVGGDLLFLRDVSAPDGTSSDPSAAFFLAVIDCEGHGVSGALMTMMVDSLLRQITARAGRQTPAAILNELEHALADTLIGHGEGAGGVSGLDIGLCLCSPADGRLVYSGAAMPLFVREPDGSVKTVNGRKRAMRSAHRHRPAPFENQDMHTAGRRFFLITDGFEDQAGGPEGRAFGTSRLKALLADGTPHWQSVFDEYRGEEPQRDDVLALAFTLHEKDGDDG